MVNVNSRKYKKYGAGAMIKLHDGLRRESRARKGRWGRWRHIPPITAQCALARGNPPKEPWTVWESHPDQATPATIHVEHAGGISRGSHVRGNDQLPASLFSKLVDIELTRIAPSVDLSSRIRSGKRRRGGRKCSDGSVEGAQVLLFRRDFQGCKQEGVLVLRPNALLSCPLLGAELATRAAAKLWRLRVASLAETWAVSQIQTLRYESPFSEFMMHTPRDFPIEAYTRAPGLLW